nr:MAG TPA: hypothetical protein [Caudoviricetes sp.]
MNFTGNIIVYGVKSDYTHLKEGYLWLSITYSNPLKLQRLCYLS